MKDSNPILEAALQSFNRDTSNIPEIIDYFNAVRPQSVERVTFGLVSKKGFYEMMFSDEFCTTTLRIYLDSTGVTCVWLKWIGAREEETDRRATFPYKTSRDYTKKEIEKLDRCFDAEQSTRFGSLFSDFANIVNNSQGRQLI